MDDSSPPKAPHLITGEGLLWTSQHNPLSSPLQTQENYLATIQIAQLCCQSSDFRIYFHVACKQSNSRTKEKVTELNHFWGSVTDHSFLITCLFSKGLY